MIIYISFQFHFSFLPPLLNFLLHFSFPFLYLTISSSFLQFFSLHPPFLYSLYYRSFFYPPLITFFLRFLLSSITSFILLLSRYTSLLPSFYSRPSTFFSFTASTLSLSHFPFIFLYFSFFYASALRSPSFSPLYSSSFLPQFYPFLHFFSFYHFFHPFFTFSVLVCLTF